MFFVFFFFLSRLMKILYFSDGYYILSMENMEIYLIRNNKFFKDFFNKKNDWINFHNLIERKKNQS